MASLVPRIAGVSVALAGTGAVLGAGLTAAVMGLVGVGVRLAAINVPMASLPIVAGLGGVLGAVLTPLTAFSLLRHVALGKALLGTMLGMAVGTSAGLVATGQLVVAAGAGVAGFVLAALVLRVMGGSRKPTKGGEPEA